MLTSSAAEKEVGCARRPASRPLALVASAELGAHAKVALLMLRSIPLQGTTPDRARRRTSGSLCGCRFCYESHARVRALACGGRTATRSHGAAPAQECVCGLNGFLPRLCLGSLHLNPRPPKDFRGSCPCALFSRRGKRKLVLPFWKEKLRSWVSFFSPKQKSKRFLEGRGGPGRTRPNPACAR